MLKLKGTEMRTCKFEMERERERERERNEKILNVKTV